MKSLSTLLPPIVWLLSFRTHFVCGFQQPRTLLVLLRMPNNVSANQSQHTTATRSSNSNNNDSTVPLSATNKETTRKSNNQMIHPLISAVGGTTSALVSALCYLALAWKRDSLMVAFFLGSIANAILSKVLKKLIQQTRPPELALSFQEDDDDNESSEGGSKKNPFLRVQPSDGGMPSSHAMSLGFIGAFTLIHLFQEPPWLLWTAALAIPLFTVASLAFRVQTKLHTLEQVVVGWTVGSANAFLFHRFVEASLRDVLQDTLLKNDSHLLPYPWLIVPAIVGLLIVGSVERRITSWINYRKTKAEKEV